MEHKRNCYYFFEEQDMGANIPCCTKHKGLGNCPCGNCNDFLSKLEADKIIRENLKKMKQ